MLLALQSALLTCFLSFLALRRFKKAISLLRSLAKARVLVYHHHRGGDDLMASGFTFSRLKYVVSPECRWLSASARITLSRVDAAGRSEFRRCSLQAAHGVDVVLIHSADLR